ncbi:mechanosensitive ion channel family protein [Nitratireductor sp. OM-1]|uniref:mechanosensitive ion channel family protein n=1 Tax=Nitratireductor sp. OM-1 TaxID=1756988 RepID=UPI000DDFBDD1|nr:mechanosensitive ion channel family protein [Nitratireductor sp. OM-1]
MKISTIKIVSIIFITLSLASLFPAASFSQPEDKAPLPLSDELLNNETPFTELAILLSPLSVTELQTLADHWFQNVQVAAEEVAQAQIAYRFGQPEEALAAQAALPTKIRVRNDLLRKLSEIARSLERKGGNADYIAQLRYYRNALLYSDMRFSDLRTKFVRLYMWVASRDGGGALVLGAMGVALMVGIAIAAAGTVRALTMKWVMQIPNVSKLLAVFLSKSAFWIIIVLAALMMLVSYGIDITPFFALIGGASFILAFAFQDTLSNLASGLMIMINRPFDEGDYVEIGTAIGKVQSVNIIATRIVTPDNRTVVVPNKQVWGAVITNSSIAQTRRVEMTFSIPLRDGAERIEEKVKEVLEMQPLILKNPAPQTGWSKIGTTAADMTMRFWVKKQDTSSAQWDLNRKVKTLFKELGLA